MEYVGLEYEYVLIENRGPGDQELTGWILKDDNNNAYLFLPGFILPAEKQIIVWTKDGTSTESNLYWGRDNGVWGQEDTAYLLDSAGTVVDSFSWSSSE